MLFQSLFAYSETIPGVRINTGPFGCRVGGQVWRIAALPFCGADLADLDMRRRRALKANALRRQITSATLADLGGLRREYCRAGPVPECLWIAPRTGPPFC